MRTKPVRTVAKLATANMIVHSSETLQLISFVAYAATQATWLATVPNANVVPTGATMPRSPDVPESEVQDTKTMSTRTS